MVNNHDVVSVANESAPPSTETSTFCIPEAVSDEVPVTSTVAVFSSAPLDGDDIVISGGVVSTTLTVTVAVLLSSIPSLTLNVKLSVPVKFGFGV